MSKTLDPNILAGRFHSGIPAQPEKSERSGCDSHLETSTVLPVGCEVIAVKSHGKGSWSTGYKVEVESHGDTLEYFLKVLRIMHRYANTINFC